MDRAGRVFGHYPAEAANSSVLKLTRDLGEEC